MGVWVKLLPRCVKNRRKLLLPATDPCNLLFMKILSGNFKTIPKEREV